MDDVFWELSERVANEGAESKFRELGPVIADTIRVIRDENSTIAEIERSIQDVFWMGCSRGGHDVLEKIADQLDATRLVL